jgi:hypothetical protein
LQYTQGCTGNPADSSEKESEVQQTLASTPQEPSVGTESAAVSSSNSPRESVGQEFFKNLHWLIREGYVIEFENGTLLSTEIIARKEQLKPQAEAKPEVVVESTNAEVRNEDIPEVGESV